MTQKRIEEEREFAAQCMLEKIDEMLEAGEITNSATTSSWQR